MHVYDVQSLKIIGSASEYRIGDETTLGQVKSCWRQAPSNYLIQSWLRYLTPYGVTRQHEITQIFNIISNSHLGITRDMFLQGKLSFYYPYSMLQTNIFTVHICPFHLALTLALFATRVFTWHDSVKLRVLHIIEMTRTHKLWGVIWAHEMCIVEWCHKAKGSLYDYVFCIQLTKPLSDSDLVQCWFI